MAKYRKKPIIIEAEQWFKNGDVKEARGAIGYHRTEGVCKHCNGPTCLHGWIDTLEGGHIVCPGDWIITGVKGEKYPCKPDIFELTYEKVEEDHES